MEDASSGQGDTAQMSLPAARVQHFYNELGASLCPQMQVKLPFCGFQKWKWHWCAEKKPYMCCWDCLGLGSKWAWGGFLVCQISPGLTGLMLLVSWHKLVKKGFCSFCQNLSVHLSSQNKFCSSSDTQPWAGLPKQGSRAVFAPAKP